ncbi:MAG: 2-amino-4-hydroxy-6-hydroxymethyldihydropteridine diphosphokinase [Firmicutes bacterium]|nr:2-amino-4-hydroxy-6-hydroxymethyldihydropteridine diphosphokinase [Bacillota bacterium]
MIAYVALGSNLGDRRAHLERGLEGLRRLGPTELSPLVMETPDEAGLGPAYLNTVARLHGKEEDPRRLLEALLRIELAQGRDRKAGRNAPRTLDLDLIAVEGLRGSWTWPAPSDLASYWHELSLTLPHPRAHSRSFVMEPLKALGTDPDGLV